MASSDNGTNESASPSPSPSPSPSASVSPSNSNHQSIIGKTKDAASTVKTTVSHTTKKALEHSRSTIENNKWLLPLKWLINVPRTWPRVSAFFGVVLALWILIFLSLGFGILLAGHESDNEVDGNDSVLAARARVEYYEIPRERLLNISSICLAQWERVVLGDSEGGEDVFVDTLNETGIVEDTNEDFLQENDADGDGFVTINRTLLEVTLEECSRSYIPQLEAYQNSLDNNAAAFDSLSFNWVRCWDINESSRYTFHPSKEMIAASRPDAQEAAYLTEWTRMQQELYEDFLGDYEEEEAFERSVDLASGGGICEENSGGTAWFFFTIMTTVGYGNQAPTTTEGRVLVVTAGLFSLILFGAVLALCGYVLLSIFDDMVGRSDYGKFLKNPLLGTILWGGIWLCFALILGKDFQNWWDERLPGFDADQSDSLWFAFISSSTIGLGDYFLQPEVVFASDTLKYSVLFMLGFVLLSNFFGKLAETLSYLLPKKHNSLEQRLANTRVFACWPRGFLPCETVPVVDTTQMVADDHALIYRIEQVENIKPDPPSDDEDARGLVSSLTGTAIQSMNVDLLSKEEELLKEWLAVVQHQKARAIQKRQEESSLQIIEDDNDETNEQRTSQAEASTVVHSNPEKTNEKEGSEPVDTDPTQEQEVEEERISSSEKNDNEIAEEETFNPLGKFLKSA